MEPQELISWTIIAGISFFAGWVIFFFWIDLMYMSLTLLALAATCGLSYGVYVKYGGPPEGQEESTESVNASQKEAEND